jgi:thiol-disulfide isomerase/thioredoxin
MKSTSLCALIFALAPVALAQSVAGLWQATLTTKDAEVPFRLGLSGTGSNVQGWFFNGDQKVRSTSGQLENGKLVLNFDYYASRLEATLKDGVLEGQYGRYSAATSSITRGNPFRATVYSPAPKATVADVPKIGGIWEIPLTQSRKRGESSWRFIVHQSGPEVSAAILRIDGDTGALTGTYQYGKFVLSHFSGGRPARLEVTAASDGTLDLVLRDGHGEVASGNRLKAVRPAEARAQNLPVPSDPTLHTGVKDPSERFHFSFPDLDGKTVSDTDARFQGKVVLVNVTGSWCPNCHDESPYLEEVYRKYHKAGLEIVALNFEEEEQLKDPARLRAFLRQYGIEYTVLLGGTPAEVNAKLPQAVNLNSWPTTFFLDRNGLVRKVHVGFAAPASGELNALLKEEFTGEIEGLLSQKAASVVARDQRAAR